MVGSIHSEAHSRSQHLQAVIGQLSLYDMDEQVIFFFFMLCYFREEKYFLSNKRFRKLWLIIIDLNCYD